MSSEQIILTGQGQDGTRYSAALTVERPGTPPPPDPNPSAVEMALLMGRGINAGEWLESKPTVGAWGGTYSLDLAKRIAEAGFGHVRIPLRHSLYVDARGIVPGWFWDLVDRAIEWTTSQGMVAVINQHHFEDLNANSTAKRALFVHIWQQMAERYKDVPNRRGPWHALDLLEPERSGAVDRHSGLWHLPGRQVRPRPHRRPRAVTAMERDAPEAVQ
jgi:hypothetical protein